MDSSIRPFPLSFFGHFSEEGGKVSFNAARQIINLRLWYRFYGRGLPVSSSNLARRICHCWAARMPSRARGWTPTTLWRPHGAAPAFLPSFSVLPLATAPGDAPPPRGECWPGAGGHDRNPGPGRGGVLFCTPGNKWLACSLEKGRGGGGGKAVCLG